MGDIMKKNWLVNRVAVLLGMALGLDALLVTVSCESSGSDGSTVTGNVETFSASGSSFFAKEPRDLFTRVMEGVSEVLVTSAYADVAGVVVSVDGTDNQTTIIILNRTSNYFRCRC